MSGAGVDVAVLGGGPAGIAAARGLRRLGYSVALFSPPACKAAIEGLAPRAYALLGALGLETAAKCVSGPGTRTGEWGGAAVAVSGEYIVDRSQFDRALQADALAHGTVLHQERVVAVEPSQLRWRVKTRAAEVECRVVVDARGRRSGRALQRGPSLVAVSQRLGSLSRQGARTLIQPLQQGWCWFATDGGGSGILQLTAASSGFASRSQLSRRVLECLPKIAGERATALGAPEARAATARLGAPCDRAGYVRCGDANVASDPLSGHGIYEALRSAGLAVAAAHTYMECATWDVVARFLNETAADRWNSTVSLAGGFYQQQAAHTPTSFWTQMATAYAVLGARTPTVIRPHVEARPVLNGLRIEVRPVVVTAQRPRGVWQIDSVDLASLLQFYRCEPTASVLRAAQHFGRESTAVANALGWLAANSMRT